MHMNKKEQLLTFPTMSWEKPIEQEILEYCEHMARKMQEQEGRFGKEAKAYRSAYETVAKHVKREISFREKIKDK